MDQKIRTLAFRRILFRIAASRLGLWLSPRVLPGSDRFLLRVSGNRYSATAWLAGLQVVMVRTTGARSGAPRTQPLIPFPIGNRLGLIASNWGGKHHPAWYYNVLAHPEVQVERGRGSEHFLAHEATGEEREEFWRQAVRRYPGYALYQKRAGGRKIRVIVLTPKEKIP
ncbi:MAG: nitroreductase family deazaflavin-dependent oxidoreductase [Rudaea sp.]